MSMIFENFSTGIILLHVLGGIIWVGGMIVIRFGGHYAIQGIEDPAGRLGRTL